MTSATMRATISPWRFMCRSDLDTQGTLTDSMAQAVGRRAAHRSQTPTVDWKVAAVAKRAESQAAESLASWAPASSWARASSPAGYRRPQFFAAESPESPPVLPSDRCEVGQFHFLWRMSDSPASPLMRGANSRRRSSRWKAPENHLSVQKLRPTPPRSRAHHRARPDCDRA